MPYVSAPQHRPTGLTAAEVAERTAAGQVNAALSGTSRSVWEIIKANVFTRFNAILGALFVLIMITRSWADGLFGLVLIINSAIGIVQEYLAKRKLDRLALLHAPVATVVRDGAVVSVPTAAVVIDDLVELRTGDQVPADGRLESVAGLEVDESNLTGESDAVAKNAVTRCAPEPRSLPVPVGSTRPPSGPTPMPTASRPRPASSPAPTPRSSGPSTGC